MRPSFETPSVTFTSFRLLPSSGLTPEFEIGLRVTNPNAQALKLRGLAYTASLDGRELIKGVANDLPVIEAYGTGDVTLTAAPDVMGGIQFFTDDEVYVPESDAKSGYRTSGLSDEVGKDIHARLLALMEAEKGLLHRLDTGGRK